MTKSSYERRYILRDQAIDELLTDQEAFRDNVMTACGDFVPDDRTALAHLQDSMPSEMNLLDDFHDNLLPTLRRMTSKTKNKQLHAVIADSYLLEDDEVALVTTGLLEKRMANLIADFINQITQQLDTDKRLAVRDNAHKLLENKTVSELDSLYDAYLQYEIYSSVAHHCLISYVDPFSSRRQQRIDAARITREQATYSESLNQRRQNIDYRLEQISRIYDNLIETIITNKWSVKQLLTLWESHEAATPAGKTRIKKDPRIITSFIDTTKDFSLRETADRVRNDELSLRVAIDERHKIEAKLAHLLNLSPTQASLLPVFVDEYTTLLSEQNNVKKRR